MAKAAKARDAARADFTASSTAVMLEPAVGAEEAAPRGAGLEAPASAARGADDDDDDDDDDDADADTADGDAAAAKARRRRRATASARENSAARFACNSKSIVLRCIA